MMKHFFHILTMFITPSTLYMRHKIHKACAKFHKQKNKQNMFISIGKSLHILYYIEIQPNKPLKAYGNPYIFENIHILTHIYVHFRTF